MRLPKNFFFTRLLLVCGLVQAVFSFAFLHNADVALDNLGERTLPALDVAADIKRVPDLMYASTLRVALLAPSERRAAIVIESNKIADTFSPLVEKYRVKVLVPEDMRLLGAVEREFRDFRAACATVYALEAQANPDALFLLHNEFRRFDAAAQALFDFKVNRASMWIEQSVSNAHRLVGFLVVNAAILIVVLGIILLRLLSAKITPASPDNF